MSGAPLIPQRPASSQQPQPQQQPPAPSNPLTDVPRIPPRPKRNISRSVSPHRDTFARSPLNDLAYPHNQHVPSSTSGLAASSPPQRPSSVDLPSIGQEGNEYANLDAAAAAEPRHTRGAARDLPLHAPTAALPAGVAKVRVATVTRTDSNQAAALGLGLPSSRTRDRPANKDGGGPCINEPPRPYSRSGSSPTRSRPQSVKQDYDDEERGIPEIGVQIPLYPNAGDVQAPTPSPFEGKAFTPGIGFFNDGSALLPTGRRHERTKSGRDYFAGPPGSYGLHGHGHVPRDQFESEWYHKHPDEAAKEAQGAYGPAIADNRKDWALSSEDLNKLVHKNVQDGGMGHDGLETPGEMVGYMASEEYTSRIASPRLPQHGVGAGATAGNVAMQHTSGSLAHPESPLRKTNFPANTLDPVRGVASRENAGESEAGDDVIHVEPLSRSVSRAQGGGFDAAGDAPAYNAEGYEEAPILASDEVTPGFEFLQPAVPPQDEHGEFMGAVDAEGRPIYQSIKHGRPNSRSNSAVGLVRSVNHDDLAAHTPLENVREYEPLFPEDEGAPQKTGTSAFEHLKRPDVLARHHFPSNDVWEDTPSSLMFETTVETPSPDAENANQTGVPTIKTFEPAERESERKQVTADDREDFLSEHTKKLGRLPARPGLEGGFPSQDLWEETPSQSLITTTITPEPEDEGQSSPGPDEARGKPVVPARPAARAGGVAIPTRPAAGRLQEIKASLEERKAPGVPDRPKPHVPPRPQRLQHVESAERVPLANRLSADSATASTAAQQAEAPTAGEKKAPPPKPAKHGHFAGFKGGFMSELQSKLQLGPQAVKRDAGPVEGEGEKGEEGEKKTLVDARKGRARGPVRRRPGASAAAAVGEDGEGEARGRGRWCVSPLFGFGVGPDGVVLLGEREAAAVDPVPPASAEATSEDPSTSAPAVGPSVGVRPVTADFDPTEPTATEEAVAAGVPEAVEEAVETRAPAEEMGHEAMVASPERAVQTGETRIEFGFGDGRERAEMTAYLEGGAQGGNVLVRAGDGGDGHGAVGVELKREEGGGVPIHSVPEGEGERERS